MPNSDNFALVPRTPGGVEKAKPGAKRILSGMVEEALELAQKKPVSPVPQKFRIGDYEWCEPDYRQILAWAKALDLTPAEVVSRLRGKEQPLNWPALKGDDQTSQFVDGKLRMLGWDFEVLPLREFVWEDGLTVTHLRFFGTPKTPPELRLCLPSLTHLSCGGLGLTELDLSPVPLLTKLWCNRNRLTELDLSPVPLLERLTCTGSPIGVLDVRHLSNLAAVEYDATTTVLLQRPDQHF